MAKLNKATITIGDRKCIYEGYVEDRDWNGWACPYFSYEESVHIMNDLNKIQSNVMYYDANTDSFCIPQEFNEIYKGVDIETSDGIKHLYPIGNSYWIWELNENEKMKFVIYKVGDKYYITNEKNYNAVIKNAKEINKMYGFRNPHAIIQYYAEHSDGEDSDLKMTEPVAREFLMAVHGWNENGVDAILAEVDVLTMTVEDLLKLSEDYKDR